MLTEFLQRHRAGFLMLLITGFAFFCMTLRLSFYVEGFKSTVWFLISPDVVYSGQFFNRLDSLAGRVFRLAKAEAENHILREQNARLSKGSVERDSLEEENNRLRDLLNLNKSVFPEGIPAEVLSRDGREWFHSFTLNKGSREKIRVSAAVLAGTTESPVLVGRVVEVQERTSKVLLLTDVLSSIAVSIQRSGEMGLLQGRNKPWASLQFLPQQSTAVPGDVVVTVGMGGLFPPGIPVGEVIKVENSTDGFFKEARIKPYTNLSSIRHALVVERQETEKTQ